MIYKSKKLFRGQVSVRSPIIESCIRRKEVLIIKYKDGVMHVPHKDILKAWDKIFPHLIFNNKSNSNYEK